MMDWTGCPLVEIIPGKVSGAPILVGTRVPAEAIVTNFQSGSPIEEISDNFGVAPETVEALLAFAAQTHAELLLRQ